MIDSPHPGAVAVDDQWRVQTQAIAGRNRWLLCGSLRCHRVVGRLSLAPSTQRAQVPTHSRYAVASARL